MSTLIDFSFGWPSITPAVMKDIGCIGGIAYAGCANSRKNISKTNLHNLLNAGYLMGLVIENGNQDALQGHSEGVQSGRDIIQAAKTLGYDYENCVLFWGGADFNENSSQYAVTLSAMEGFASQIPIPGYYGDSDSIDYIYKRHPDWVYWQSDSTSFSPLNPTPNACLLQRYNDPRAKKYPVDIDNILKPDKLFLMGADMSLTDDDAQTIWGYDHIPVNDPTGKNPTWTPTNILADIHNRVIAMGTAIAAADDSKDIAAVKAELDKILAMVSAPGGVDTGAVVNAIKSLSLKFQ